MSATKSQSSCKHVAIERLGHWSINQDDAVVGSGSVHIPNTNVLTIHVFGLDVDNTHLTVMEHAKNFSTVVISNCVEKQKRTERTNDMPQVSVTPIIALQFLSRFTPETYRTP